MRITGLTVRVIDRAIVAAMRPGAKAVKLRDSDYLFLRVKPGGRASWSCIFTLLNGQGRELGLGSYPDVKSEEARAARDAARALVRVGIDPVEARRADRAPPKSMPSFGELAQSLIAAKESGWKHPATAASWRQTVRDHCAPLLSTPVNAIDTEAVLSTLVSAQKRSGGSTIVRDRVRGVVEAVLDAAKVKGHRSGENPAIWRGNLKHLLPKRGAGGNYAAMPYADVPAFMVRLREVADAAATATVLEFVILTAVRSGEAVGARWSEFDLDTAIWTIPAARMKTGKEHRVPLSPRAIAIVEQMATVRQSSFVFPGAVHGKPFSHSALRSVLARMGVDATVHGFRSSFRDWAGEETATPREIAEAALAHVVGGVEGAYRRGDALEKRRVLMDAWSTYLDGGAQVGNVVQLRA